VDRTNANDFRANLKEWLEAARTEPIKITRKSGESFILINADVFEKMQVELTSLSGVAKGLTDVIQGRTRSATPDSIKTAIKKAKDMALNKRSKKVVGHR